MSVELIHLSCWTLLAAMVVFLVVGGIRTFHEFRDILSERRARRNHSGRKAVIHSSGMAFRLA